MSLAARTLTQPALQPRPLSRFEPDRRGDPVMPAEETELRRTAAPAVSRSPRPRLAPPLVPVPEAIEEHPRPGAEVREERPHTIAGEQAVQDDVRPMIGLPPETAAPRRAKAREQAPAPAPVPPPRVEPVVLEKTTVLEVPIIQREREVVPARTQTNIETRTETREVQVPVEKPGPRETRSRYEEVPPIIPDPGDESPPPLFREESATTPAATRRTREVRSAFAPEPSAPAPQPEIHVSIGRVEVRATTVRAAGKGRRDQPRVMTIDDYVAHRARKERP